MAKYRSPEHTVRNILESSITGGKLVGSRGSSFRRSSTSNPDEWRDRAGHDVGARRNTEHERAAVTKAQASAAEKEKEVKRRNQEAEKRQKETLAMAKEEQELDEMKIKGSKKPGSSMLSDRRVQDALRLAKVLQGKSSLAPSSGEKKEMAKEEVEASSTTERRKIKNVARTDDPNPTSSQSKLSKQAEIKTKIIDEEKTRMSKIDFGLPRGLIEATKAIMEKKTQIDMEPETNERDPNGDEDDNTKSEAKSHTKPKTDKEKKLAALAEPKDKITHKDVLVGRGVVRKEETEIDEKTLYGTPDEYKRRMDLLAKKEKALPPGISSARKALAIQRQKLQKAHSAAMDVKKEELSSKEKMKRGLYNKEEVEQVDEAIYKIAKGTKRPGMSMMDDPRVKRALALDRALGKLPPEQKKDLTKKETTKEEIEQIDEISRGKIKNYLGRAFTDVGQKELEGDIEKAKKRKAGIDLATRKGGGPDKIYGNRSALGKSRALPVKPVRVAATEEMEEFDVDSLTEEQLEEVLKKSQPAGEWIKDFVHSKDPKFAGKSKKERMKMALGAYYAKQNEEIEEIEEVLDSTMKKIGYAIKGRIDAQRASKAGDMERVERRRKGKDLLVRSAERAKQRNEEVDVEFTYEEIERLEAIAAQLDEQKPTMTSAPVRGANQDQSGFGVKKDTADYTISDSKKMKMKEEMELEEGRGRPKKSGEAPEGDDTAKHPVQQLHKIATSIQGSEPHFEHKDGSKTRVSKQLAKHITSVYGSMRTTQEKDDFAKKLHASRDSMMAAVNKHIR